MYNALIEKMNQLVIKSQDLHVPSYRPLKDHVKPSSSRVHLLIDVGVFNCTCLWNKDVQYVSYFDESVQMLTIHSRNELYTLSITKNGYFRLCHNNHFVQLFCSEDISFDGITMTRMNIDGIVMIHEDYVDTPVSFDTMHVGKYYYMTEGAEEATSRIEEPSICSTELELLGLLLPILYKTEPSIMEGIYLSGRYLSNIRSSFVEGQYDDLATVAKTPGVTWYISNMKVIASCDDGNIFMVISVNGELPTIYKSSRIGSEFSPLVYFSPSANLNEFLYPNGIYMQKRILNKEESSDFVSMLFLMSKINKSEETSISVNVTVGNTTKVIEIANTISQKELYDIIKVC